MFLKNYFYSIEWKNLENKKIISHGLIKHKKIKNNAELQSAITDALIQIELEYEDEIEQEYNIKEKYKVLAFNQI